MNYNYILIAAILLLTIACRSYQEKSRKEKSHHALLNTVDEFRQNYRWQETDNFRRMWYFQADTNFRYHTDSGIMAGSGSLWLVEKGGSKVGFHQFWEQHKLHVETEGEKEQSHQKRSIQLPSVWWIVPLSIATAFLFFQFRRRK